MSGRLGEVAGDADQRGHEQLAVGVPGDALHDAAAVMPRPAPRREDEAALPLASAAAPHEEMEAVKHRLADMRKRLDKIAKGG